MSLIDVSALCRRPVGHFSALLHFRLTIIIISCPELFRKIFDPFLFSKVNMNNKATGKKPVHVKDHEKISQPMKIRRGETINFVGNTTLTRVNSAGQKNVVVDKSAHAVDHGNGTRPKVTSVRTAYKSAARLFSQGSSNAHTPVAPKEVPKKSNFTQTNCAKARPGQKVLTKVFYFKAARNFFKKKSWPNKLLK